MSPSTGSDAIRRFGAVDMGSNSTRLLIADVSPTRVDEVVRLLRITRLAEGVDRRRRLAEEAMARTLAAVDEFAVEAARHGAEIVLATATSAARDAENRDDLLRRVGARGFETRLLSGDEEAALTFRGVTIGRPALPGPTVIVDVGGGSTEVVAGTAAGMSAAVSIDAGCVRAAERWTGDGRVPADVLERARAALTAQFLAEVPPDAHGASLGIATAGTATTLAMLDLGLDVYDGPRLHGHVLGRDGIEAQLRGLAAMDLAERLAIPGMEPGRASVLVAGVLILAVAMDELGLDEIEVSERDILHGIAAAAAELDPRRTAV